MPRAKTTNAKWASTKRARRPGGKSTHEDRDVYLCLIALFKLFKGLLLVIVAIGALRLLHQNVAAELAQWIAEIRVDPNNHYIHKMLMKLGAFDDRKLEGISAGSFIYAALLFTEGTGLLMRKRWAEYFTIITTASLIPLEIYELILKSSVTKIIVTALNIAVVCYLFIRLRRKKR
jgi:uncharacterized membrane protein (DUF2068 family)